MNAAIFIPSWLRVRDFRIYVAREYKYVYIYNAIKCCVIISILKIMYYHMIMIIAKDYYLQVSMMQTMIYYACLKYIISDYTYPFSIISRNVFFTFDMMHYQNDENDVDILSK